MCNIVDAEHPEEVDNLGDNQERADEDVDNEVSEENS